EGVVERRHLDEAGAELAVDGGIGDEWDLAPGERQDGEAAGEVPVALVVRVVGDRGVAQYGLRPGRRDDDALAAPGYGVGDVVELPLHRPHLDLEVGDRGLENRRPVDQVLAAGDEPLGVEADERLADRPRETLVHREALAGPVAGGA